MYHILLIAVFARLAAATPTPDESCKNIWVRFYEEIFETIDPNYIIFTLFTNSANSPQVIRYNDVDSLHASSFNNCHPTHFIIHGLSNDRDSEINQEIKSAYLERGQYNIIVVVWKEYATIKEVLCITYRISNVGAHIGQFINWLSKASCSSKPMSVIGYSLGAHVAGHVGKYLNSNADRKLHTIVGLDPSMKCRWYQSPENRLAPSDAEYVEVIHTSYLGTHTPLGTADFYPYWGSNQLACNIINAVCSHSRAYEYFAESIRHPNRFMSTKCLDYEEILSEKCTPSGKMIKMGGEPSNHGLAEGIYYYSNGSNLISHMFLTLTAFMFVFVRTLTV